MSHLSPLPTAPFNSLLIPADNATLSNEITRLAGHINAAQHRFLTLLAALIERNAWEGDGIKSPAHWLNYYCGIDLGAAREKVRVAKCLQNLPGIDEAFRSGVISYSKVRAMTRSAMPQNEAMLLQVALHGTAQHVEQLVRKYHRAEKLSDRKSDASNYDARELTCFFDEDGMLVIRGRLAPEDGAVFMGSLNAMLSALNPPVPKCELSEEFEQKTFPQKRADALLAMAEQAVRTMDNGLQPVSSAEKFQVVVHVGASLLANPLGRESIALEDTVVPATDVQPSEDHHRCSIECGDSHFPLSAATARRLCCDASMVMVQEDSRGNVLNVGRRTRTVPPSTRRALQVRDGGCRFPGCCESRYVDAHHVQHWCDGGETKLDNLVLLCRHHHRLLHQEGYEIVRNGDGAFLFVTPQGRAMARAITPQFDCVDEALMETLAIEREHDSAGLEVNSHTAVTRWQGGRMDYDLAVGAMLSQKGHLPGFNALSPKMS
ncbi:MAG: hypothetical protein A3H44_13605 [Gammaproteobacteria bacterium RIFCSPLOWO2_02_FULL_57_10]|nr:MAG: hypothetical protein A3H44_13605 [Gammaproteobacteria bacterium RIFCSPLOWO2_02_FULL_57_10]